MALRVVLLPAPLAPKRATMPPSGTVSDTRRAGRGRTVGQAWGTCQLDLGRQSTFVLSDRVLAPKSARGERTGTRQYTGVKGVAGVPPS